MPIAATHKKASLYYIAQYTPWLQKMIDAGAHGELKGNHRYIFHDYATLKFINAEFGADMAREALVHIILDLEQYREKKILPIPN